MNRIILIGNGFDLAHGLKTSYGDFMLSYVRNAIKEANSWNNLICPNKELFELSINSENMPQDRMVNSIDTINNFKELMECFKGHINIKHADPFIFNMLNKGVEGWVDVEKLYFKHLLDAMKFYNDNIKEYELKIKSGEKSTFNPWNRIRRLNNSLKALKKTLITYLVDEDKKIQQKILKEKIFKEYLKIFIETPIKNNISNKNRSLKDVYFLNFNYTKPLEKYIDVINKNSKRASLSYIHGNIDDEQNTIFGYGDETDPKYKEIEYLDENDFLKGFKSFGYNKSSELQKLSLFLDKGDYEVMIIGHSCGLSDRVMLKEIFEHDKCTAIRVYYCDKVADDYDNKIYNISRHFENNGLMRKKLITYDSSRRLPQFDDK